MRLGEPKHPERGVYVKLQTSYDMNKIQELYFKVQNGEGFSVLPESLTPYPFGGYAVGGGDYDSVHGQFIENLSWNTFQDVMNGMMWDCEQAALAGKDVVIGGWVREDGWCVLEISDVYVSMTQAIDVAMLRHEEAIWDFNEKREIKMRNESKDI